MLEREKMLLRIYRECFKDPDTKELFFNDWFYVAQVLADDEEDILPDAILEMVCLWLDDF